MKIDLSEQALEALKNILERVRKADPSFLSRTKSATVSQVVLEYGAIATDAHIETLAVRLITPKNRRRALIRRIADLAVNADEQALKTLEKNLARLRSTGEKPPENQAKSADFPGNERGI